MQTDFGRLESRDCAINFAGVFLPFLFMGKAPDSGSATVRMKARSNSQAWKKVSCKILLIQASALWGAERFRIIQPVIVFT
jgi:hypothetical protein